MRVKIFLLIILLMCGNSILFGQKKYISSHLSNTKNMIGITPKAIKQGYNISLWLFNNGQLGCDEANACDGLSLEYPVGSQIEHLYVGSLFVGAIVDGKKLVTQTFNTWDLDGETRGTKDRFFQTSIDTPDGHNLKGFDDDADGKIDEDELDGEDNDGDWDPLTDDVGSDGLADPFEVSCDGKPYDPILNPDPAGDNYDPYVQDKCHPNPDGSLPYKNNPNVWTEKNGIPDHGEPHVDEDHGAVSENDLYCTFIDTFVSPIVRRGHIPLGLRVLQKSYAWKDRIKEPILPIDYSIVNIGNKTWKNVFICFYLDLDVGPMSQSNFYEHNYTAYFRNIYTFYTHNPIDRGSTPLGITVLSTQKRIDSININFHRSPLLPGDDDGLYDFISGNYFDSQGDPKSLSDTRFYVSFGPFEEIKPKDTLNFSIAFVSGDCVDEYPNSLKENAIKAILYSKHNYYKMVQTLSPPLHVKVENEKVLLDWKWTKGDKIDNPEDYWDEYNEYLSALPDSSWRKMNPPLPNLRGGRNFEGYKVWKSESENFDPQSFHLVHQYDVDDELGFGNQTGLKYTLIDTFVLPTKSYWYAVTSYTIPSINVFSYKDFNGEIIYDTLTTEGYESSISENAIKVSVPFSTSLKVGEVKVVPNPYRGDVYYTDLNGYEGREEQWTPEKRVVWFIHLPKYATIRVYSILGEVIATINHNDDERLVHGLSIGQEEFSLFSSSGRPLASGVYLFTVDSEFGQQIGKFVIIK